MTDDDVKAPQRIWLQWTAKGRDWTWHWDQTAESDVEYVRADIVAAERDRLIAERDAAIDKEALTAAANRDGVAWVEAAQEDMARLQADRDRLLDALRWMVDAFYDDPLGANTTGAVDAAKDAIDAAMSPAQARPSALRYPHGSLGEEA
jgi:hypothetical protein